MRDLIVYFTVLKLADVKTFTATPRARLLSDLATECRGHDVDDVKSLSNQA